MSGPVFMEELSAKFIGTLKGMCAEIVTLSLNHISRELRRYQRIEIVQCRKRKPEQAVPLSPHGLQGASNRRATLDFFPEIRSEQQMFRLLLCLKSSRYIIQEYTAMMQPPRHIRAMDARSRSQPKDSDAFCNTAKPCA